MSTKLRKQKIKCTTGKLLAASQAGPLKCTMLFNCQTLPSCKKLKKRKSTKKKHFRPSRAWPDQRLNQTEKKRKY
jgi:hypothetical protein